MRSLAAIVFLVISLLGNFAPAASGICEFKTADGANLIITSPADVEACANSSFKLSLLIGDVAALTKDLRHNPNLIYSCHEDSHGEWVTPLILAVCDGTGEHLAEVVKLLLRFGKSAQANCATPDSGISPIACAKRIEVAGLQSEIVARLTAHYSTPQIVLGASGAIATVKKSDKSASISEPRSSRGVRR